MMKAKETVKPTTKGRNDENSFSEEYESEDEDESMKIAMKMSQDQEALDKQKFAGVEPNHMGMMSDTDGFKKVLEMSRREEEARLSKIKTKAERDYERAMEESLNQATSKNKND